MTQEDPDPAPQEPLANKGIWGRGLTMLLILILFGLAQSILAAAALIQFLWMLLTSKKNQPLAEFGEGLGLWLAKAARFEAGTSDDKPFPWSTWGK